MYDDRPNRWHTCFTVGHALLDAQHKKLFKMCHELSDEANAEPGSAGGSLQDRLHELMVHVVRHFRTEEQLLADCAYADLENHKAAHEDYLQRLSGLVFDSGRGRLDRLALVACLNAWWVEHILDCDKHYSIALSGW